MAYYTALITAWNGATQPPAGVTGTGLNGGMTTAQKIAAVNGWTIVGSVPTAFYTTGAALWNCVNWVEFAALSPANQAALLQMCCIQGSILGGSANAGIGAPGMFLAFFTNHSGPTIAALTALAAATVQPWWQVSVASGGGGLNSSININDTVTAGLS